MFTGVDAHSEAAKAAFVKVKRPREDEAEPQRRPGEPMPDAHAQDCTAAPSLAKTCVIVTDPGRPDHLRDGDGTTAILNCTQLIASAGSLEPLG